MRRNFLVGAAALLLMAGSGFSEEAKGGDKPEAAKATPDWSMNATAIEACSCPMFCPCYFDTKPASPGGHAHHSGDGDAEHAEHAEHARHGDGKHADAGEHFCRFNMGYKVNKGHYGDTKLDGALFWFAGDLGHDWSKGETNWAVLTFDPAVTAEQRAGIEAALATIFPVKWSHYTVGPDAEIDWHATKDRAEARLDGGKAAEVVLNRFPGNTDEPIVISNLRYWGAPRNEGFVLMPNEVQALRRAPEGQEPFEFKGTNGFMITVDVNSADAAKAKAAAAAAHECD